MKILIYAVTSRRIAEHLRALQLTQHAFPHGADIKLVEAKPWTISDYSRFMVEKLSESVGDYDFVITVNWDGYAINRNRWTDDFFRYDYIGAPWSKAWSKNGCRVGNGGFSLRSKAWISRAAQLGNPFGKPEDTFQCRENLDFFTSARLRVAPIPLAMQFSAESRIGEFKNWRLDQSFGFHSWMMPCSDLYRLSIPTKRERWHGYKRRCLSEFLKHF